MIVKVLVVHPMSAIVQAGLDSSQIGTPEAGDSREVPTSWFPTMPKIGQRWNIQLEPVKTSAEQYARLNQYLTRG